MDIKSVSDMKKLGASSKSKTEDYDAPTHLVKPHEGDTMYPYVEKEYLKSKKDQGENSPFVTTSYKQFLERQKKVASSAKKSK